MTKRISQANTVVVPVVQAHGVDGQVVAEKVAVAPAGEVTAKADAPADAAPTTVVAQPVVALVAPAAMAMVAEPVAAAQTTDSTTTTTTTTSDDTDSHRDVTPYIVGGVLLAGGILAVALSSGDNSSPAPAPSPTPTPPPTNAVTFSSGTTASVAENTATNGTTGPVILDVNAAAAATGGAITYALSGADAALFTINSSTGEIRLNNSANFESTTHSPTYNITVTATSAANGTTPSATASQNIVVTITNVNENPTFASATATATVAENTAIATPVYTAAATDPDAGTTLTYTLGGTDAGFFNINAQTGVVTFKASPDFESTAHAPTYTFTVTATDNGSPALSSTAQTVTVNVTNVNDNTPVVTSGATASIAENTPTTTAVYTATATDADAGTTLTYALGGTDASFFNINAQTGVVTFKASPDFESTTHGPAYNFTVTASDGTNVSTPKAVTVNVTDVAEGPPAATVSLDTNPTASGLGAGGAAQATTFTDSANAGSNATISNFGTDDQILFTNTTSVSFSSNGNDLTIQFTNAAGTITSDIKILNVVTPNDIITNEANANAALNAHFGTQAQNIDFFKFG